MAELSSLVLGLIIVVALAPLAICAVQLAKRQRGSAVLVTGLLLIFGMSMQIVPPPPPVAELVRREAEDDDGED
jgi:high-affinity K+ transport system ATPase subunit B